MPSITPNLRLSITNRETNKPFLNWRLGIDGPDDSNMIKLDTAWGNMKTMVDGAMAAVGHAYKAATVAEMTDHDKAYVYVGSETGYTNGNWYYWNEDQSAWVSGGVYNAIALQTDDTLTLEGEAADAKATGEMIVINGDSSNGTRINITTTDEDIEIPTMDDVGELETHIGIIGKEVEQTGKSDSYFWIKGYWNSTSEGVTDGSSNWARSNQQIPDNISAIYCDSSYFMILAAYNGTTALGIWNGQTFAQVYDASYGLTSIDMIDFREKFPAYTFRLSTRRVDGASITISDVENNVIFVKSRNKITDERIDVICGDIVKPEYWENGTVGSDGNKTYYSNSIYKQRISTYNFIRILVPITIVPKSGYALSISTFSLDKTQETYTGTWQSTPCPLSNPNKLYKIVVKAENGSNVSPDHIADYIDTYPYYEMTFEQAMASDMNVKVAAHRGLSSIAPENTLPAYELAGNYGFRYVEMDVRLTSDGVPVLLHDKAINSTARNADGTSISETVNIADITYEQALEYDFGIWKNSIYAGTKIPTLNQALYCCKVYNLHVYLDIKQDDISGTLVPAWTTEQVSTLISIIRRNGMENNVTFASSSKTMLETVSSLWDTVELGYLKSSGQTLQNAIADAKDLQTGENRVFMIFSYDTSATDLNTVADNGFQVDLYGLDGNDSVTKLRSISSQVYDLLITDNLLPGKVVDILKQKYKSVIYS